MDKKKKKKAEHIPSLLFIWTLIPSIPSPVWPNPCIPKSPSTPQSIHGSAELHGRQSMFEDPAQDRAWFVADPALQDPGLNLTFTLFVNGFCFLFLFFVTNRENLFFLFFVCCWDGALIYNPNIDALHCRNL